MIQNERTIQLSLSGRNKRRDFDNDRPPRSSQQSEEQQAGRVAEAKLSVAKQASYGWWSKDRPIDKPP